MRWHLRWRQNGGEIFLKWRKMEQICKEEADYKREIVQGISLEHKDQRPKMEKAAALFSCEVGRN